MTGFVPLTALAAEFAMDRSHLRRYVLKHGFDPVSVRTPESRSQLTLALSSTDAEAVRALRQSQGFGFASVPASGAAGSFYVIRVVPEFAPNRVKLGFAGDVAARLSSHQTSAPTAELIKAWPCERSWEPCAIRSLTRTGCRCLANEVFECDDLAALVARGDAFFALMPEPSR